MPLIWSNGGVSRPVVPLRALSSLLVLVVGTLAVPLLLLGSAGPAQAARDCTAPGVKVATRDATAVFVGTVNSSTSESVEGERGTRITHEVQVSGVWKGTTRITSDVVSVITRSNTGSGCALGKLPDDSRFVFFARADGNAWAVSADDGTAAATDALVARLDRIYGEAKPPVVPSPTPAVFTAADTGAPLSTGRAAAPGAALVLVGLLGLVLVRRVNRG